MQILQIGLPQCDCTTNGCQRRLFRHVMHMYELVYYSSQVAFDHRAENGWAEMNGGPKLGHISSWPPAFHTEQKQQMGRTACDAPLPQRKAGTQIVECFIKRRGLHYIPNHWEFDVHWGKRKWSYAIFQDYSNNCTLHFVVQILRNATCSWLSDKDL